MCASWAAAAGVIYLAEHRALEKLVALKVISPTVLDNSDAPGQFKADAARK
jgi:hypothetical protein